MPKNEQVGISVNMQNRKVVVQFDQLVGWLTFTPQQAIEFARAISEKAIQANKNSVIQIPTIN